MIPWAVLEYARFPGAILVSAMNAHTRNFHPATVFSTVARATEYGLLVSVTLQ